MANQAPKKSFAQKELRETLLSVIKRLEAELPNNKDKIIKRIGREKYKKLKHLTKLNEKGSCAHLVNRWIVDFAEHELKGKPQLFFTQYPDVRTINHLLENLELENVVTHPQVVALINLTQNIGITQRGSGIDIRNVNILSDKIEFLYTFSQVSSFTGTRNILDSLMPGRKYRIASYDFSHSVGLDVTADGKFIIYDPIDPSGQQIFDNSSLAMEYIFEHNVNMPRDKAKIHFMIDCYAYNADDITRIRQLKNILNDINTFILLHHSKDAVVARIAFLIKELRNGNLPYENYAQTIFHLIRSKSGYFQECQSLEKLNDYLKKNISIDYQTNLNNEEYTDSYKKHLTALIEAAYRGDYITVEAIIENLKIKLEKEFKNDIDIQKLMLKKYIDQVTGQGSRAIDSAIQSLDLPMVKLLIVHSAEINKEAAPGKPPALEIAIENNATEITQLLLDNQVNITANAFDLALKNENLLVIRLLLQRAYQPTHEQMQEFVYMLNPNELVHFKLFFLLQNLTVLRKHLKESQQNIIADPISAHKAAKVLKLLDHLMNKINNHLATNQTSSASNIFRDCINLLNDAVDKGMIGNNHPILQEVIKFQGLSDNQLLTVLSAAPSIKGS